MRIAILATVLATGCGGRAVPVLDATCAYDFEADADHPASRGEAACGMGRDAAGVTFALAGERAFVMSIATAEVSGYARLEEGDTSRPVVGAVYGLVELDSAGCTDWGGHVRWVVGGDGGWALGMVANGGRCTAPRILFLNGSVSRADAR